MTRKHAPSRLTQRILSALGKWLSPFRRRGSNGVGKREQKEGFVNFKGLEKILRYSIRDQTLFLQALTHRSFLPLLEDPNAIPYERLEFLGDSILNLVVAEYLYNKFPNAREGELTQARTRLVNRKTLAALARDLRLDKFVLLSNSAQESMEKGHDSLLADSFEAIVAAMYLESGLEAVRKFLSSTLLTSVTDDFLISGDENYKSILLEFVQAHGLPAPHYVITKEEGPDHDRTFTVEVLVGNERLGVGVGRSKKEAEQRAAERALSQFLYHNR